MDSKKKLFSAILFVLIMGLTIYTFLHGQDLSEIFYAVSRMNKVYMVLAVTLGLLFVSLEGIMIYILLHSMGEQTNVFRCVQYSFIGFFYSGITPSATGGQPMQLYYMNRDGRKNSNSTVVLMTVAVMYKLVLVLIGISLLLFWNYGLLQYLGSYYYLYIIGLLLNIILVGFILAVMLYPVVISRLGNLFIRIFSKIGVIKDEAHVLITWSEFVSSYGAAVNFLKAHKSILIELMVLTFMQRCSVFLITYFVYLGFSLNYMDIFLIMALQASVYIAVDMLPIPGAQGITELMYKSVFTSVFPVALVTPSMLVSRSVNFYFLLLVSLLIVIWKRVTELRKKNFKECHMQRNN